jgi:ABC-type antimicrobial peptide transport system permease subunit
VVRSTLDSGQILTAARQVVQRLDARLPLIFPGSMQAIVDEQLARPRFYLVVIALFAVLAVLLAAVGIYGVVAHVVTERTREIGVRIALGAKRGEVVGLMLWQGVRPASGGLAIGLLIAIAASRVIRGLLYEVQPHDPLTYATATGLLMLVVILACAIPAARASRIAPAEAIRGE